MLSKHERDYGWGMDALVIVCLEIRTRLWLGHGCSGNCMLLKQERNYGWGMDALLIVCFRNTYEIMVGVWMLWQSYAEIMVGV